MNAPNEPRIPALDGIRGLAILMIMQYHFWGLSFGLAGYQITGVDVWAAKIRVLGWTSVDLFFVLSGFLITGILLDAKAVASRYFQNFYGRRFLRIFPLYYGFLIFVLVVVASMGWMADVARIEDLRDVQVFFWLYLVNFAASVKPLDANIPIVHAHFWTLALEEQFYIVWPFVVIALSRRQLLWLCIALPFFAFAFRMMIVADVFPSLFYRSAAHVLPPARMDTLAMGAIAALAVRGAFDLQRLARMAPYVAWGALAFLGFLFVWRDGLRLFDSWTLTIGFTAVALLWFSVLIVAVTSPPDVLLVRFLTHPVMKTFGTYSYCLYVIHLLVSFELAAWLIRNGHLRTAWGTQLPFNLAFNIAATATCFAIAFLSWHLFEKQFLRLKVFFRSKPQARAAHADDETAPAAAVSV